MGSLSKAQIASLVGVFAAVLVLIGSAGPWATLWIITVNGLQGDGIYTAGMAILCGGLLAYRAAQPASPRFIPLAGAVLFVICLAVGVYYLSNIQSAVNETQEEDSFIVIQVGWGLYVLVIGALSGVIASVVAAARERTAQAEKSMTLELVGDQEEMSPIR